MNHLEIPEVGTDEVREAADLHCYNLPHLASHESRRAAWRRPSWLRASCLPGGCARVGAEAGRAAERVGARRRREEAGGRSSAALGTRAAAGGCVSGRPAGGWGKKILAQWDNWAIGPALDREKWTKFVRVGFFCV